jgi:hypothetical protein
MTLRRCCPPSCCPGGATGATAILAVPVAIVAVAILEHIFLLVAVAGAVAACWVIAIAVVMVIARYTVKPLVVAADPEPYRVTATVIPQAVQAERLREVPAPMAPAIENHVHYHLHLADQRMARVLLAGYEAGAAEGQVAGYAAGRDATGEVER